MYSLTHAGILVAVAVPVVVHFGFSEACSGEIVNYVLPLLGGVLAWIGRIRAGGVTVGGFKK
jgi:hypothetical protein